MKSQLTSWKLASAIVLLALGGRASGQTLYSQNFDVDNQGAAWNVNNGPSDEAHDFFFDYSTVGIPTAPNSGGTTRGMKLQANLIDGVFSGMSVSPVDQSFTGDYKLSFDVWSNYIGNTTDGINNIGATAGSSMLSTFGVMTGGTAAQWPGGATDSVWFAAVSDTNTTAYRIYSNDRPISYRGTAGDPNTPYDPVIDGRAYYYALDSNGNTSRSGNPNNATFPAGKLYLDLFPVATVPTAQTMTPGLETTQFGSSPVSGVFGFRWHQVEITKAGNLVSWKVDGVVLGVVDTTDFTTQPAGTNISFGHSDTNAGTSINANFPLVQFTLVDNVDVSTFTPTSGDFNASSSVEGFDFLAWQRNYGTATGAHLFQGDADNDNDVDDADFVAWRNNFGTVTPAAAAGAAIPEPANWCSAAVAALACLAAAAPRRRLARVTVRK